MVFLCCAVLLSVAKLKSRTAFYLISFFIASVVERPEAFSFSMRFIRSASSTLRSVSRYRSQVFLMYRCLTSLLVVVLRFFGSSVSVNSFVLFFAVITYQHIRYRMSIGFCKIFLNIFLRFYFAGKTGKKSVDIALQTVKV